MQQRRVRLGDILDDYCPRERRITNHAVVAMIEDTVKQTRCTTCDADHEYRDGKAPSPRKRKAAVGDGVLVTGRSRPVLAAAEPELELDDEPLAVPPLDQQPEASEPDDVPLAAAMVDAEPDQGDAESEADADSEPAGMSDRDEWPVHRPLIRATLPRPEGQVPERKAPDFTFRPAGGRFDTPRNGQRKGGGGGHRPARQAQGQPGQGQGRFGGGGGPRTGSGHGSRQGAGQGQGQGQGHAQGQRHGNRAGVGGGNRPAQSRGPRQGGGSRKRGR
jgi:hypothetical protein